MRKLLVVALLLLAGCTSLKRGACDEVKILKVEAKEHSYVVQYIEGCDVKTQEVAK